MANNQSGKLGWIYLNLLALIIPGLTAIVLVLLRSLKVNEAAWRNIFQSALVIHVDLSIYAWMLLVAMLLVSLSLKPPIWLEKSSIYLSALGLVFITVSPFTGTLDVHLSNYLPVIASPWFYTGLLLFALASFIFLLLAVVKAEVDWGLRASAILYFMALFVFAYDWLRLADAFNQYSTNLTNYFELLFWGAGHVLQLVITCLLMLAWVKLIVKSYKIELPATYLQVLYWLMLLCGFAMLAVNLIFVPQSPEYRIYMTGIMQWGNGFAPVLLTGLILWQIGANKIIKGQSLYVIVFYASLIVFAAGGFIGLMISGSNTIVPAHYHGSVVGVTIALMGLVYLSLPKLNLARVSGKLALVQPMIYAAGQLVHITGLMIIGSAGAARKLADSSQLAGSEFGVLLVRTGGLLAVVGGILFIVLVLKAIRTKSD